MRSVVREVAGSFPTGILVLQTLFYIPTGILILQTLFYIPMCILSSKTKIFEKTLNQIYPWVFTDLSHMMRLDLACFVLKSERSNHCAVQYFTMSTFPFKTIYTRFYGFSTPVISFWLICTTRGWDRGSVWGHTLFLSELKFFSIHAKPHFFSRSRPSFDYRCEPYIVPKKIVNVFCLPTKIL